MLFSKLFLYTLRQAPKEAEVISHQLSLRAGLLSSLASGVFSYLPLGLRVLRKVENIIRRHMNELGGQEVLLPALQPLSLWQKTGRDEILGETMIRFKDRRGREMVLGPTHEEVITDLVAKYVNSYKQLPLLLYQIQTKFRDEIRPRFGVIRSCEFIMKDAYSFDATAEGLDKVYNEIYSAYLSIFSECGLQIVDMEADTGFIGGSASAEFLAVAEAGEDIVYFCPDCNKYSRSESCPSCKKSGLSPIKTMEVGHIFKLGTKYSQPLKAYFLDEKGKNRPLEMGCYGIGVSRIIAAIIEAHHDEKGIVWPEKVSPFTLEILPLGGEDSSLVQFAFELYHQLQQKGYEVLLDERKESAGVKFNDALLLGLPYVVVVGKNSFGRGEVEIYQRRDNRKITLSKDKIIEWLEDKISYL